MKNKFKYKKILYISIYTFLIILIVLSTIYIFKDFLARKEIAEENNLLNKININETQVEVSEINNSQSELAANEQQSIETEPQETERMLQVKALQEENSDIVGWLEIENTPNNYPVLQGTDNEYYMSHNYKEKKPKNGSIFLNKDYDWNIPSNNLLIYGHNLNN